MDGSCPQTSQDRLRPRGWVLELAPGVPRGFGAQLALVPVARLNELPWWGKRGAEGRVGHVPPWAGAWQSAIGLLLHGAQGCSPSSGPPCHLVASACPRVTPGRPMGFERLSQSSPSFLISLWVGTTEDRPVSWRGDGGHLWISPSSRGFLLCLGGGLGAVVEPRGPSPPPPHVWQFLFCRCSRVCSNVAPRCSHEPCRR